MIEVLVIALPDHRLVFRSGIPDLTAIQRAAFIAKDTSRKAMRRVIATARFLSLGKLCLYSLEHFPRNDGRMTMLDVVLRHLAFVYLHFLGQEIRAEGLLQDGVALVFLVGQNAFHRFGPPLRCIC